MHFSAKCNSGRIAIQWFHIKHYLDYPYTKFQAYTFWVQKMCVFARYATLVPRLYGFLVLFVKVASEVYVSLMGHTIQVMLIYLLYFILIAINSIFLSKCKSG